jgi:hypothetical protein
MDTNTPIATPDAPIAQPKSKKKPPSPAKLPPAMTPEESDPGTPQFRHRVKMAKELAAAKGRNPVVDTWVEVHSDKTRKKGGKVLVCSQMKNGNVHRKLVGFERGCADFIAKAKAEGKLRK